MVHEFEVRVSPRHARLAVKRFIVGGLGWSTLAVAAFCLFLVGLDLRDGELRWTSVMILTLLGVLSPVVCLGWFLRRRRAIELIEQLGGQPVTYRLRDEAIETASALGGSTLDWQVIRELWISAELVMLFYARGAYTTIPGDQIPDEALSFLRSKVESAGGKIVDRRDGS